MQSLTLTFIASLAALAACAGNKEPKYKTAAAGSSAPTPQASGAAATTGTRGVATDEVAQQVLADLASNAFGNQKVDRRCVTVSAPAVATAYSTVAAAKLLAEPSCGDSTARRMLWLYVRAEDGAWNEEFLGNPPPCWKDVPAEITDAVARASGIPKC